MIPATFKILVIDTDTELLSALELILTEAGFSMIASNNSRKAIQLAEDEKPQLILLELLMPELDGIDICLELKKRAQLSTALIVFHTQQDEDYSQIAAFNAGADDYIIKPVKARVLISRIKALLKRHHAHEEAVKNTSVGLSIDRERYLIFKDGEEIVLPRKEFELLALLHASPRKVFTRTEISQLIWGYDFYSKNRTIDVHIRKLREKLGNKYIKTIKGVGYSLDI